METLSIKQRIKFPHFGSANIDSLRRASTHTLKSLRARSDYLGDKDVNKRGSTLRVSDLLFFYLVQSDLRYSRAYCKCLGICKSSASSVPIDKNRKTLRDRRKHVDHGSRSKINFIAGRVDKTFDKPYLEGIQKALKPCLPMCFKLVSSRL